MNSSSDNDNNENKSRELNARKESKQLLMAKVEERMVARSLSRPIEILMTITKNATKWQ